MNNCIVLLLVIFGATCAGCGSDDRSSDQEVEQKAGRVTRKTPPPKPPTMAEQIASASNLVDAIRMVRPMMTDARDDLSPGAAVLAEWMNSHLNWAELKSFPETSYKKVLKDPESERGLLLCQKGRIVQIQVDRSVAPPIYHGIFSARWSNFSSYLALGSTGNLVEDSRTKFCGIVIGTFSYSNVMGGITHSVQLVGMFDLKENRKLGKPKPEEIPPEAKKRKAGRRKKGAASTSNVDSQEDTQKKGPATGFKF